MTTMRPPPRAVNCGSTARASRGSGSTMCANTRRHSASSTSATALFGAGSAQLVDAGSLAAGALSTVADVSGCGVILVAAVQRNEDSAVAVRGRLTIDGLVVSDLTSDLVSGAAAGTVNVGMVTGNAASLPNPIPIRFKNAFKYEVSSGTDRVAGASLKIIVKHFLT